MILYFLSFSTIKTSFNLKFNKHGFDFLFQIFQVNIELNFFIYMYNKLTIAHKSDFFN